MLTHLLIKNFKAWKDTGPIRLAPLTVIFGANSAGKSSLGHLLLALRQTTLLTDRKRALHLGDQRSAIDLGTFGDCLHDHDLNATLEFTIGWKPSQPVTLKNLLRPSDQFRGTEMRLNAKIQADKREQPALQEFQYQLINDGKTVFKVEHGLDENAEAFLATDPDVLVRTQGRGWPVESPEKFYRFSDITLARYQNASMLAELPLQLEHVFDELTYLGPLREPPKRTYSWGGDSVPDVGPKGEFAIAALLAATAEGRRLNRRPKTRYQPFESIIAHWLKELGVISEFKVKPVAPGRKEYEVLVRTQPKSARVRLTDIGFGASQVLPALVQAFYAAPHSTIWMEQPEIHLHPKAQAALADALISATQSGENTRPRNVQLIIESHSEAFLMRLQRRIAEGRIDLKDVAIYFVAPHARGVELEELEINLFGDIENWPEHFFGDEFGEIAARTQAAMKRKQGVAP